MVRTKIGRRAALGTALALPALNVRAQAEPVTLISHRYPALEWYADKMKTALPGVTVDARLMPSGDAGQLQRLQFSAASPGMDILWLNGSLMAFYAKNGWIEPLDDLIAKFKDEYKLGDINPTSLKGLSYDGKIYGLPLTTNTLMYAYREDVFAERKLQPPTTWEQQVEIARQLHSPRRSGTTLSLKWDMPPYELSSVLNTVGDGWFDKNWRPTFHTEKGQKAIDLYKRLSAFAVPGFTSQANDENTVNFAQDVAATGQQWATRCATMDNPQRSKVVGKMQWAVPPGGRQALSTDGYAISKFSAKNKEMLFRILAKALDEDSQRGAADLATPTRRAVLNDPATQAKFRWYPAVSKCLEVGEPLPALAEFNEAGELACKRIVQAIVGQMPVKEALTTGATEVTKLLTRRGYYKG